MATWKSRGLRGSVLEEMIGTTNNLYASEDLALIQKIPTPITPIDMDHSTKQIKLAYFDKKSTVDYIGVAQGIPICFDAKECATDRFTLANIHEHQVIFMQAFEKQEGIAFFLIHFTGSDRFYYLRLSEYEVFEKRAFDGGRKSFAIDELDPDFFIEDVNGPIIPYLDYIQKDINLRPES
ncbi:MAG: Holliday junction resolvase RecU [Lachnospiraceae bacterium]|nr:Holliday junction resolvase RecU [Lachnospiraceae bacterium]